VSLELTINENTTAGESMDVTVTAKNSEGTAALAYSKTVTFSSEDGQAVLPTPSPYTFTTTDAGVKSWTGSDGVTLKTAGTKYVKVEDDTTPTPLSDQKNVDVAPGALDSIDVSGVGDPITAGTWDDYVVKVYDAYGNLKTNFVGILQLSSDDAQADLNPVSLSFSNEAQKTASPGIKFKTTGDWYTRALDTTTAKLGEQTVTVKPDILHHFVVSGLPTSYEAGLSTGIWVKAQDVYDNRKTDYTGEITFESSDSHGQRLLPQDYTFTTSGAQADNGEHWFEADWTTTTVKLCTSQEQWVRVKDKIYTTCIGTQTVTVAPKQAQSFSVSMVTYTVAGTAKDVTITAKDEFANTDTNYSNQVRFTSDDTQVSPGNGLPNDYAFTGAENGVKTFTGDVVLKTAGTKYVKVYEVSPDTTVAGQQNVDVKPNICSKFDVSGIANPATAGGATSATVEALDEWDNVDTVYTGTVTFESNCPNKDLPVDYQYKTTDAGVKIFGGIYLNTSGGPYYVKAYEVGVSTKTGQQSSIYVNAGAATKFLVSGIVSPRTVDSVSDLTVKAVDNYDNVDTGYTGTVGFESNDQIVEFTQPTTAFYAGDEGQKTLSGWVTLKSTNTDTGWYVKATEGGKTGQESGIIVCAKPESDVSQPSDDSFVKTLGEINGTAWAQSPALLTGVGLSVKDVDGTYAGNWWNESGWGSSEIFNPVTLYTSTWTYSTLPTWENGVNYYLKPKVQDDLGGVTESMTVE